MKTPTDLCINGHDLAVVGYYKSQLSTGAVRYVCKACHAKSTKKYDQLSDKSKERRRTYYINTRNAVWRRYSVFKSVAKHLHRDFTLTQEDYAALVESNTCNYCGGPLPEVGYGIDRLNNRLGYVHGNVVPCCEQCNEKKGSLEGIGFTYPRTEELLRELIHNKSRT